MVAQLIWIAAVYGLAVALVHILQHREHTRHAGRFSKRLHYILITRNHEAVIEGYIRLLAWQAFRAGKAYQVTLMDDESRDGTVAVAARLARSGSMIEFVPLLQLYRFQDSPEPQQQTVIDLRKQGSGGSQSTRDEY
ncbi:hypothetical protein [Paenibacillus sp. FSL R7-0273]|uniref:hypothetical protein n=1 Tax=Paenibacillus sp. FSL R7-0273 TaxID=1536772 RepID=UPI00063F575B|nr:hypothetical protein [Paenibacillus sp. FSL R7-0273]OMF92304.1 hypothetical protein BK144_13225 [Paenibacillus sp. FSL R7-0273]